MTVATSMQLQVPAQAHEDRDWRGQFTHLYNLDIQLPTPARFDMRASVSDVQPARGMTGYLYIDCQPKRELVKNRQRNDHVLVQPSIPLLIKQLRKKLYPGDEEVYTFPVTHIAHELPGRVYLPNLPVVKSWEYIKIDSDLQLRGRTAHRPHQNQLDAATSRLKYFYVHLGPDVRAKLSVWLDQLFEEGVLT